MILISKFPSPQRFIIPFIPNYFYLTYQHFFHSFLLLLNICTHETSNNNLLYLFIFHKLMKYLLILPELHSKALYKYFKQRKNSFRIKSIILCFLNLNVWKYYFVLLFNKIDSFFIFISYLWSNVINQFIHKNSS